jgi:hypothetical protein
MPSTNLKHVDDPAAQAGDQDEVVRGFGNACLIKRTDGRHELVGGNENNFTEAKEWVSLFAHEIVFKRSFLTQRPDPEPMRVTTNTEC